MSRKILGKSPITRTIIKRGKSVAISRLEISKETPVAFKPTKIWNNNKKDKPRISNYNKRKPL